MYQILNSMIGYCIRKSILNGDGHILWYISHFLRLYYKYIRIIIAILVIYFFISNVVSWISSCQQQIAYYVVYTYYYNNYLYSIARCYIDYSVKIKGSSYSLTN